MFNLFVDSWLRSWRRSLRASAFALPEKRNESCMERWAYWSQWDQDFLLQYWRHKWNRKGKYWEDCWCWAEFHLGMAARKPRFWVQWASLQWECRIGGCCYQRREHVRRAADWQWNGRLEESESPSSSGTAFLQRQWKCRAREWVPDSAHFPILVHHWQLHWGWEQCDPARAPYLPCCVSAACLP